MMQNSKSKIPQEIESMSVNDQKVFYHNLREESEINYKNIYSDYRKQWKQLNIKYDSIFSKTESNQKDFVKSFHFVIVSSRLF
jgi:hypothetical protein